MEVTEASSVHRATEFVCQFYQQFIYEAFIRKELSEICTLHLRRSLCHQHLRDIAFISGFSIALCALLYNRFSLSLHISEEPVFFTSNLFTCLLVHSSTYHVTLSALILSSVRKSLKRETPPQQDLRPNVGGIVPCFYAYKSTNYLNSAA